VPHQVLHAHVALSGGGQAHHQVALAGELVQQHLECGEQRGHETGAAAGGGGTQVAHQSRVQFQVQTVPVVGLQLGARTIGGEVHHRCTILEQVQPIALHAFMLRALGQVDLGDGVVTEAEYLRQIGGSAPLERRVEPAHVGHDDAQAPAVHDHVVAAEAQQVMIVRQPHEIHPEQRAAQQVERRVHVAVGEGVQLALACGLVQPAQVHKSEGQVHALQHDHAHAVGADGAAQPLVPFHELMDGALHRCWIQLPVQVERYRFDVGAAGLGAHLRRHPHFALGFGGGRGAGDGRTREGVEVHRVEGGFGDEFLHTGQMASSVLSIRYFPARSGSGTNQAASPSGVRPKRAPGTGGASASSIRSWGARVCPSTLFTTGMG
jgi:hypothetical protein